ncbi:MAG: choice-of-anchor A family protein [Candidatus Omnitrophica bacterium]|nr:choice-of-anchor A family protein [Candidatus Omnitrophota bacterium]
MKRFVFFLAGVAISVATLSSPNATASLVVPDLGEAANYALFAIPKTSDAASITISSASGVLGDLAIGNPGLYDKSGAGVITGSVFLATGVTTSISGVPGAEGTLVPNSNLAQAISDALLASTGASLLPSTQLLGDITDTTLVTGNGNVNVLSIGTINLGGVKTLTLSGNAAEFFILNISGDFDFSGSSAFVLAGGVDPSHVLLNFPTTGNGIGFSASSAVKGTFLAPYRDFTLHGANLEGAVIANDIRITSGGQDAFVGFNDFAPPPPPQEPVIPEPSSLMLLGMGLAALVARRPRSSSISPR